MIRCCNIPWPIGGSGGSGFNYCTTPVRTQTAGLSFGQAIDLLKMGVRVKRANWNGKNMWLKLQVPDAHSKMTLPYIYIEYPEGHPAYPKGSRVPWLASQTDILTDDWEVVND